MAAQETNVVHHRTGAGLPQSRHGAAIVPAGIEAETEDDVAAAFGCCQQSLGAAGVLITGRAVRQDDLRCARMQSDQHRVGPQLQCVMHDVKSRRQVNGAMGRDRLPQRLRVISVAVAFGARIMRIDPGIARGQGSQIRDGGGWHRAARRGLEAGFDGRLGSEDGEAESVEKIGDDINWRGGVEPFPALAQRGKDRHIAASDSFDVDFVARTFLHPKNKGGTGNVFQARVLDAKFVHPFRFDGHGRGHAPEERANKGQPGFVFENRGFTLVFKRAVNERELPAGRRF